MAQRRVHVRREGGFRHLVEARSHRFAVDEPREAGGGDSAPTPLELLAGALGACTAATVEMYAERKGWELASVEVDVSVVAAHMGEPARLDVVLRLPSGLEPEQVQRLASIARACPVRRALEGAELTERVELLQ